VGFCGDLSPRPDSLSCGTPSAAGERRPAVGAVPGAGSVNCLVDTVKFFRYRWDRAVRPALRRGRKGIPGPPRFTCRAGTGRSFRPVESPAAVTGSCREVGKRAISGARCAYCRLGVYGRSECAAQCCRIRLHGSVSRNCGVPRSLRVVTECPRPHARVTSTAGQAQGDYLQSPTGCGRCGTARACPRPRGAGASSCTDIASPLSQTKHWLALWARTPVNARVRRHMASLSTEFS